MKLRADRAIETYPLQAPLALALRVVVGRIDRRYYGFALVS